jgi:hypothetical protein
MAWLCQTALIAGNNRRSHDGGIEIKAIKCVLCSQSSLTLRRNIDLTHGGRRVLAGVEVR